MDEFVNWDGRYEPSECQRMSERDAWAMADALERALPDIPDQDLLSDKPVKLPPADAVTSWGRLARAGVNITAYEEFSGRNKEWLRYLIVHLREPDGIWIC